MLDASTLPMAENLKLSRELLKECAELGIVLEIEIGVVGGEEDGVDNSRPSRRQALHFSGRYADDV